MQYLGLSVGDYSILFLLWLIAAGIHSVISELRIRKKFAQGEYTTILNSVTEAALQKTESELSQMTQNHIQDLKTEMQLIQVKTTAEIQDIKEEITENLVEMQKDQLEMIIQMQEGTLTAIQNIQTGPKTTNVMKEETQMMQAAVLADHPWMAALDVLGPEGKRIKTAIFRNPMTAEIYRSVGERLIKIAPPKIREQFGPLFQMMPENVEASVSDIIGQTGLL